jgi:hypothetical protein
VSDTYATIVADPPWRIPLGGSWTGRVDKGRPQRFYNTMVEYFPILAARWVRSCRTP